MRNYREALKESRRKEERHHLMHAAVAALGKQKGQVVDVSKGGIGIRFDDQCDFFEFEDKALLDLYAVGFQLDAIPVQAVTCKVCDAGRQKGQTVVRCGFEFGDLEPHRSSQISIAPCKSG